MVLELNKKISERDLMVNDSCPHCSGKGTLERQISSSLIGYSTHVNGSGKPDDGFRDLLRNMHKRVPGSRLDQTNSFH